MPVEQGWSPIAPAFSSPSSPDRNQFHDSEPRHARPWTPERHTNQPQQQNHHAFSSPLSSPTFQSPMNMGLFNLRLGSSPLSPLRGHFPPTLNKGDASPTTAAADLEDELDDVSEPRKDANDENEGPFDDEDADLAQDSKDVLMDRLNDLLHRLAVGGSLKGEDVSNLHAKVDEMEKVLASDPGKPARSKSVHQALSLLQLANPLPVAREKGGRTAGLDDGSNRRPSDWGLPVATTTPARPLALRLSSLSWPPIDGASPDARPPRPDDGLQQVDLPLDGEDVQISSEVAEQVVLEAEKLCAELSAVLKNLQDRREESDHLHAMLIDRAESAARRILELDELVSTLEDEIDSNKSELEHLRLQLRAVEVLCYEYVPPDADRDLLQSIENWKADYSTLKVKMAARRRQRHPLVSSSSEANVLSPNASVLMEKAGLYR